MSAGPTQCQFQDPLALTPYSVSALQCIPPSKSSFAGQCLLGPQKHGDGCSVPQECASGTCLKELRMCRGTDEGEACTPGLPDACQPAHYCAGGAGGDASMGTCAKSVSPGGRCAYPTACASGTFCTGPDASFTRARCAAAFTVDTGANTTIGPYMCKTGNAIMVAQGATLATSVYTCVTANSTRVGEPCVAARGAPPGYQCRCAEDGTTRLRTVGALGLGGRSAAWRDLYTCLLGATGPTGDPCLFDSADLETVRYGSCVYYACYPQYLARE